MLDGELDRLSCRRLMWADGRSGSALAACRCAALPCRAGGRAWLRRKRPAGGPDRSTHEIGTHLSGGHDDAGLVEAPSTVSLPVHHINLLSWRYGFRRPQEAGSNAVQISVRSGDLMSFGYCMSAMAPRTAAISSCSRDGVTAIVAEEFIVWLAP
jgi:hypothetical protein